MKKPARILLVDDIPGNIELLSHILAMKGYSVSGVPSGQLALRMVQEFEPDLILLDVMMPGMDGFETCQLIRQSQSGRDIPIIFVTARTDPADIEKGLEIGAVDYITKPLSPQEVWARVEKQLQIQELMRKQAILLNQLSLQENRYREIIYSASDAMLTVTPPGNISWTNPAACKLFGFSEAAMLQRQFTDLLAEPYRRHYRHCFRQHQFGAEDDSGIVDQGQFQVDAVDALGLSHALELAVNQVGLNYPLFLCHFHVSAQKRRLPYFDESPSDDTI